MKTEDKPLSEKAIFIDGEYMQFDRDVKEAVDNFRNDLHLNVSTSKLIDELIKYHFGEFK